MKHGMQATLALLLQQALDEEMALAADLASAERSAEGTSTDWSAKDTMAHVGAWKERLVRDLDDGQSGTLLAQEDIGAVNQRIFDQTRGLTWPDVLALLRTGSTDLIARVRTLSDMSQSGEQPTAGAGIRPLWRRVVGIGYIHSLTHISQLRIGRGQGRLAVRLSEAMVESLLQLDDTPHWRGELLYDLACTYALAGEVDRALETLAEALRLQPELFEWSRTDPDFAPIRSQTAYQALYSTEVA